MSVDMSDLDEMEDAPRAERETIPDGTDVPLAIVAAAVTNLNGRLQFELLVSPVDRDTGRVGDLQKKTWVSTPIVIGETGRKVYDRKFEFVCDGLMRATINPNIPVRPYWDKTTRTSTLDGRKLTIGESEELMRVNSEAVKSALKDALRDPALLTGDTILATVKNGDRSMFLSNIRALTPL